VWSLIDIDRRRWPRIQKGNYHRSRHRACGVARGTRPLFYQGDVPTMDGLVMVDVEFVFGLDGWWLDGMGRLGGKTNMDSYVSMFYVEAAQHLWTRLECLTRGSSPAYTTAIRNKCVLCVMKLFAFPSDCLFTIVSGVILASIFHRSFRRPPLPSADGIVSSSDF
jgi:hypothetical protein